MNDIMILKFLRRSVRRAHQYHELGPTLRFGYVLPLSAPWNFPCGKPGRRDGVPIPVRRTIFYAVASTVYLSDPLRSGRVAKPILVWLVR